MPIAEVVSPRLLQGQVPSGGGLAQPDDEQHGDGGDGEEAEDEEDDHWLLVPRTVVTRRWWVQTAGPPPALALSGLVTEQLATGHRWCGLPSGLWWRRGHRGRGRRNRP